MRGMGPALGLGNSLVVKVGGLHLLAPEHGTADQALITIIRKLAALEPAHVRCGGSILGFHALVTLSASGTSRDGSEELLPSVLSLMAPSRRNGRYEEVLMSGPAPL